MLERFSQWHRLLVAEFLPDPPGICNTVMPPIVGRFQVGRHIFFSQAAEFSGPPSGLTDTAYPFGLGASFFLSDVIGPAFGTLIGGSKYNCGSDVFDVSTALAPARPNLVE